VTESLPPEDPRDTSGADQDGGGEVKEPEAAEALSRLEEFIEPAGLKGFTLARILYWVYWTLGVGGGIYTVVVIILYYVRH